MSTATRLGLVMILAGLLSSITGWSWLMLKGPAPEDGYAPGGIHAGFDTFLIALGGLWLLAGTVIALAGTAAATKRSTQARQG